MERMRETMVERQREGVEEAENIKGNKLGRDG